MKKKILLLLLAVFSGMLFSWSISLDYLPSADFDSSKAFAALNVFIPLSINENTVFGIVGGVEYGTSDGSVLPLLGTRADYMQKTSYGNFIASGWGGMLMNNLDINDILYCVGLSMKYLFTFSRFPDVAIEFGFQTTRYNDESITYNLPLGVGLYF
jgi:hypothetical protein